MPGPALSPLEQQILQAKMKVRAEMPDVADTPVEPMSWLDRLIAKGKEKIVGGGQVVATAHPSGGIFSTGATGGSVTYNPDVLAQLSPGEQEDTIAHELKHIQQNRQDYNKGIGGRLAQKIADLREFRDPYGRQPHEQEAYQFEGDRAVKNSRVPSPAPKFELTPADIQQGRVMREMSDINLPEPNLGLLRGATPAVLAENVRKLVGMGYSEQDAVQRAQREAKRTVRIR
jgi:hypothetical protein